MNAIYDKKDEEIFDGMVSQLKEMNEQEQKHFMVILQGYRAGVQAGLRIAEQTAANQENETA